MLGDKASWLLFYLPMEQWALDRSSNIDPAEVVGGCNPVVAANGDLVASEALGAGMGAKLRRDFVESTRFEGSLLVACPRVHVD